MSEERQSWHDEHLEIVEQLREIRRHQHTILHKIQEIEMALNAQAQAIVDAINNATNAIGAAITAATTAITDLAAKVAAGTIDPTEFQTAIQPSLDALTAGAAALTKTATDADPTVNPSAPPIPPVPVVPAP